MTTCFVPSVALPSAEARIPTCLVSSFCPKHTLLLPRYSMPNRMYTLHSTPSMTCPSPEFDVSRNIETPLHPRIPFLGSIIDIFFLNITNIHLMRRYGNVFKTDFFGTPVTVITDLDAIVQIFGNADIFRSAEAFPGNFQPLFGDETVSLMDGQCHRTRRLSLAPVFSPALFHTYFSKIVHSARLMWDEISQTATPSKPLQLFRPLRFHTFRVIADVTMPARPSEDPHQRALLLNQLVERMNHTIEGLLVPRFGPVWARAVRARKSLRDTIKRIIIQRIQEDKDLLLLVKRNIPKKEIRLFMTEKFDFLTSLIATSDLQIEELAEIPHSHTTLDALVQSVLDIWGAGYASPSSKTLACVMELASDSEIFHHLRKEQSEVVELTYEAVSNEMPLLHSFVREVLRMYPATYYWFRKTRETTEVCGHRIDEGTILALDIWGAQRNHKYFEDPDSFRMDRFIDDAGRVPAIASFGGKGSVHYCLGDAMAMMSIKTTLSVLLREYDLEIVPRKAREYRMIPELIPKDGVQVIQCRRRN